MTDTQTKARPRPLKTAKYLFLGVLLCAVVGLVCFFAGQAAVRNGRDNTRLDAVVVESQLAQINELATVSYNYTNMAQFQSSNDFYGVTIPFTTKRFILTYDGVIKAGVDLGAAQVEVEVEEGRVSVTLPPAAILSHEIEPGSVKVFDEKTSIFNPFTVEDFSAFQEDQKAIMEDKALEKGLLDQAGEKARDSVRAMLVPLLPPETLLTVN